jgi:hypothetical protein
MLEIREHGVTGYRLGCRCADCRKGKADDTRARRHEALYGDGGPMGPKVRKGLLAALRRGESVVTAATALGISHQQVYAAARAVPEFGAKIDELT